MRFGHGQIRFKQILLCLMLCMRYNVNDNTFITDLRTVTLIMLNREKILINVNMIFDQFYLHVIGQIYFEISFLNSENIPANQTS